MTPSLEGWPTKAKEAPSPHEVRLAPLDTNPVFQSLGGISQSIFIIFFGGGGGRGGGGAGLLMKGWSDRFIIFFLRGVGLGIKGQGQYFRMGLIPCRTLC